MGICRMAYLARRTGLESWYLDVWQDKSSRRHCLRLGDCPSPWIRPGPVPPWRWIPLAEVGLLVRLPVLPGCPSASWFLLPEFLVPWAAPLVVF